MKLKICVFFSIILFLTILSINFISACDWSTYGNSYTPLWNEQLSPENCYGSFDIVPYFLSLAQGMTAGNQSLIINMNNASYLFFNNGNYLQVYDKNLILQQEALTGVGLTNLDGLDFNYDGNNELANLYSYNSTQYVLKVYSYIPATNSLTLIYSYNITTSSIPTLAGLRHSGGNIYFTNSSDLIKINQTDFVSIPILATPTGFIEPLSFYNDYNGDGIRDFMTFNKNKLIIFDENGNLILELNYTASTILESARMISPLGTALWKVAVLYGAGLGTGSPTSTLRLYNLDGSTFWSKDVASGGSSSQYFYGDVAISDDYDGDNLPDIYVADYMSYPLNSDQLKLRIYKGTNGNLLAYNDTSFGASGYTRMKLTLADMNHDGKNDFILNLQGKLYVFDAKNNQTLFNSSSLPVNYCVPADLNFDGSQDITCSGSGSTTVFFTNYTNQNAVIQSVTYDTGTIIAINSNLNMYVTLTDAENNLPFYCSVDCFGNGSYSAETGTSLTCFYNQFGQFNNTLRCRDVYHAGQYDYISQIISVTQTGITCNNDGICDISQGETNANCPNDCQVVNPVIQAQGGSPIPTKLVDTTNIEQGLFPSIYYGILGFFSYTLIPLIVIVFVIFFALIILSIGTIIKKIAKKV